MTFLPLTSVHAGTNDRKVFPEAEIRELAENIAAHGLAQPPTVRPVGNGYEIVAGERRYRAHVMLATEGRCPAGGMLGSVECNVRELSDRDASAIMLAENLARTDLRPVDEAEGYASRIAAYGLTPAEVAAWAGVSTFRVSQRLRLLKLSPEARALVDCREGGLPVGHAERMADLDVNRQALMLAAWAESGGTISKAGWSAMVAERQAEQDQDSMFSADQFLQVSTYVTAAAKCQPSTKALRKHLQRAVRALEAAGLEEGLCAEIRATWSESWNIAGPKVNA